MTGSRTKYAKILDMLKSGILSGHYSPEVPFPSERALIRRYGLSRNTIQHALRELIQQGFLESRRGSGNFVTRQGASRKIGLLVPGLAYSEFFPPIVSEISRLARQHEYSILFGDFEPGDDPKRIAAEAKRFVKKLVREGVAGVIYQPLEYQAQSPAVNAEILGLLQAAEIPVVLVDYDILQPPERSPHDIVGINNHDAACQLANLLLSKGLRKIDFAMRPHSPASVLRRHEGVRMAVAQHPKASCQLFEAAPDDLPALRRHLRGHRPDAFICGNDATAAVLKKSLNALGVDVPRDCLLAGFDDLRLASLLTPPLTTVHQPCMEIGRAAFTALVSRITGASQDLPREIFLPAPIVERGSTDISQFRKRGKSIGRDSRKKGKQTR